METKIPGNEEVKIPSKADITEGVGELYKTRATQLEAENADLKEQLRSKEDQLKLALTIWSRQAESKPAQEQHKPAQRKTFAAPIQAPPLPPEYVGGRTVVKQETVNGPTITVDR